MNRREAAELLGRLGVGMDPHPGRSLFEHLVGTFDELDRLGVGDPVRVAGLCHAVYGTDGLGQLTLADRPRLRREIGAEAEHLVYLYAITDQHAFVGEAAPDAPAIVDRRGGSAVDLGPQEFESLLTMWLGNELELLSSAPPAFMLEDGPAVWAMLERNASLLPPDGMATLRERAGHLRPKS